VAFIAPPSFFCWGVCGQVAPFFPADYIFHPFRTSTKGNFRKLGLERVLVAAESGRLPLKASKARDAASPQDES
jgi:hypothetical protein